MYHLMKGHYMQTLLNEQYILMYQVNGEYELCFEDKYNTQLEAPSFEEAKAMREVYQEQFNSPIVIVRQSQVILEETT